MKHGKPPGPAPLTSIPKAATHVESIVRNLQAQSGAAVDERRSGIVRDLESPREEPAALRHWTSHDFDTRTAS
jgi:hypothetical protein